MTVQADDGYVYPTWSFGDRVRKARDLTGLNQKEFAAAIGASEGSIATWETDRAKPRDIVQVAKRIEMLTRIPAEWTLGIDRSSTPPGGGAESRLTDSNRRPIHYMASSKPTNGQLSPHDSNVYPLPARIGAQLREYPETG
jgi:transcriptional regulator with XRE-family HTH domain